MVIEIRDAASRVKLASIDTKVNIVHVPRRGEVVELRSFQPSYTPAQYTVVQVTTVIVETGPIVIIDVNLL